MFDFGVGYSELFVLALVAVIVIGPKDLPRVLAAIEQHNNRQNPPGLLMTPEAISNRERQARYRAGKTKHWEPRAAT